jgi:tRNA dimethylallyltransferase
MRPSWIIGRRSAVRLPRAMPLPDLPDRWVVALEGPTAVGKTAVAIALARAFGTEIVSADARQVYRELRIGVARPSPEELAAVPHHFIADRSVQNPLSAGGFEREGLARLAELHRRHRVVILAGGSGLYVKALLEGLDAFPPVDPEVAGRLRRTLDSEGIAGLQALLDRHDPAYAAEVDRANPHRLLRALGVTLSAGRPYSDFRAGGAARAPRPFRTLRVALERDRDELHARIDARVDAMLAEGLEDEARALLPLRRLSPLDTVGYREWFAHVDGTVDREEAIRLIRRNTRRYAKRQATWLRRQPIDRAFRLTGEGVRPPEGLEAYLRERTA